MRRREFMVGPVVATVAVILRSALGQPGPQGTIAALLLSCRKQP
jgi:hypothetical protein